MHAVNTCLYEYIEYLTFQSYKVLGIDQFAHFAALKCIQRRKLWFVDSKHCENIISFCVKVKLQQNKFLNKINRCITSMKCICSSAFDKTMNLAFNSNHFLQKLIQIKNLTFEKWGMRGLN